MSTSPAPLLPAVTGGRGLRASGGGRRGSPCRSLDARLVLPRHGPRGNPRLLPGPGVEPGVAGSSTEASHERQGPRDRGLRSFVRTPAGSLASRSRVGHPEPVERRSASVSGLGDGATHSDRLDLAPGSSRGPIPGDRPAVIIVAAAATVSSGTFAGDHGGRQPRSIRFGHRATTSDQRRLPLLPTSSPAPQRAPG